MKNAFEIDYANAPDVRGLFDAKAVGDTVTLCVKVQVNAKDEEGMKGSIVEVGLDDDEEEKEPVAADETKPIMVVMKSDLAEKSYA